MGHRTECRRNWRKLRSRPKAVKLRNRDAISGYQLILPVLHCYHLWQASVVWPFCLHSLNVLIYRPSYLLLDGEARRAGSSRSSATQICPACSWQRTRALRLGACQWGSIYFWKMEWYWRFTTSWQCQLVICMQYLDTEYRVQYRFKRVW